MRMMRIFSDKYAATIDTNGAGEYVDGQAPATAQGASSSSAPVDPLALMISAPAQAGAPDTVVLPRTGHVLSLPRPGESMGGYSNRVNQQTGGRLLDPILFGYFSTPLVSEYGGVNGNVNAPPADRAKWPEIVDRIANPLPYLSAAERDQHAAAANQWGVTSAATGGQNPTPASSSTGQTEVPLPKEP